MININLIFVNSDNYIEQLTISANKDILVNGSSYFKSLLEGGFIEANKTDINIDLKHLEYTYNVNQIYRMFDIELTNNSNNLISCEDKRNIKVVMDTNLDKESKPLYDIKIDLGLGTNVKIHELYILSSLASFFDFVKSKRIIENCLDNYKKIIGKVVEAEDVEEDMAEDMVEDIEEDMVEDMAENTDEKIKKDAIVKPSFSIIESIVLYFDEIINLNSHTLNDELDHFRKITIINEFLQNIYYNYLGYTKSDRKGLFNDIVKMISKTINNYKKYTQAQAQAQAAKYLDKFDMTLSGISLTVENLKQMPLEECYDLINIDKNIISLDQNTFKLYDFYDILDYEKPNWETFVQYNYTDYKVYSKCIKEKEIVLADFYDKTKGIFEGLDWSNMIVTGGFIFGLVNNLNNSLINGTDIDIFVYADINNIVEEKVEYLLRHFSNASKVTKPYYVTRGKVITLIIPTLDYDIQIIPTHHNSAFEVVNSFDFSYVKTYYDGSDIYTTLDGLISLKHGLTIYKSQNQKEDNTINDVRLYKTIIKGLQIKYDPSIKNRYINGKTIDLFELEKNENIKLALNKASTVKKLMKCVSGIDLIPIIKAYYRSRNVTMDIDNIGSLNINDTTEYDHITNVKNTIDVNKITGLSMISTQFKDFKWFSFLLNSKKLDHITLETEYCNFAIYHSEEDKNNGILEKDVLVLNLDDNSKQKIDSLVNRLKDLSLVKTKDKEGIILKKMFAHNNMNTYKDIDEADDNVGASVRLKVHVNKNKSKQKQNERIKETLKKLDPSIDKVKVICSCRLWSTPSQGGLKFYIDDIKCNRSYNML